MTEIPPAPDEDEDDEDQALELSPALVAAKSSLVTRCKSANIEVEDKLLPGEETQVLRVFMKCGRDTRVISLFSEAAINSFLSVPFEKYVFLNGLEAICSYELGTIEAAIRPVSNNTSSVYTWRRLFGLEHSSQLPTAQIRIPPDPAGLPEIELSLASRRFLRVQRGIEACKALGETTILGVLVPAELAQPRPQLAERPEVEAERIKMARLKQLRLEKEAAEASTAALKRVSATEAPRTRSTKGIRDNPKASAGRIAKSKPKSLSDWITQQKGSGGRY